MKPRATSILVGGLAFFIFFQASGQSTSKQSEWKDAAYNKTTGEQLSMERWQSQLPESFDLFETEEALELIIESDFKQFIRDKDKDKYQEALLHFSLNDSVLVKRIVRIKPRGVFRRKYCSVPPIKLNMKKTEIYVESMQQLEKMKVVSECKTTASYEDYVLREYLIYKLYQLFSDYSFKVRLIRLTTVDTGSKKLKTNTSFAFLIEEADDLAKRSDLLYLKIESATSKDIVHEQMAIVSMFQYMISNVDWSIAGAHNFKLMKDPDPAQTLAFAVPYDFDSSGLVNAPYAAPPEKFGLSNIRMRLFRCPCYSREIFEQTVELFKNKKSEVFDTIENFTHLSDGSKKDIINFVSGFYRQLESQDSVDFFMKNCGTNL